MSRCTSDCIPKGAAAFARKIRSSISLKILSERSYFFLELHMHKWVKSLRIIHIG